MAKLASKCRDRGWSLECNIVCFGMDQNALSVGKSPRIVLVEDERSLSWLFEHCLQDWFDKMELLTFENGEEARSEWSGRPPDLLILDCAHSGVTGDEILQEFGLEHAKFPILLISEFFQPQLQLFSEGGVKLGFLSKPFGVQEFWGALNQLVGPSDHPELQALVQTQVEAHYTKSPLNHPKNAG